MPDELPTIDPAATALLVMDYQDGIVARIDDPTDLLARMAAAIAAARARGLRIGYVRVAFTDQDYAALPQTNANFSALAAGRMMDDDAPHTQVHEAVAPEPGDIVVRKVRVGAFSTTDLDGQLRRSGVDTLVLAGIATSGVVLSTVRDAADRDYRVLVVEDLCADTDPEVHRVLTTKVFPRQATVISSDDLRSALAPPSR
jgi:nicotinamidase-related amidase